MNKTTYQREYYRKRHAQGLCTSCSNPSHGKWQCPVCRKKQLKYWKDSDRKKRKNSNARKLASETRKKILQLLGGKCSNPECAVPGGMKDWRALQIDHVNGGGTVERQKLRNVYQYYKHILEAVRNGSKDFQLLCANCNWIKKYQFKESPRTIY